MSRTRSVLLTDSPPKLRIELGSSGVESNSAARSTNKIDKGKARAIDSPLCAYDLKDPSVAGKIYAWAAHPSNAALCFGIDIVNAQPLRADGFPGSVYLHHQRPLVLAEMFVDLKSCTGGAVDDGTTVLQAIHNNAEDMHRQVLLVGSVARLVGRIRSEWDQRVLQVDSMSILTNPDDEARHVKAVLQAKNTEYAIPFELTRLPLARMPAIPTAPELSRLTTIPAAYLPPVYTNAAYYSRRGSGSSSNRRTLPSPGTTPTRARYESGALSGPTLASPESTPPRLSPRFSRTGPTLPSPSPSPSPEETSAVSKAVTSRLRSISASSSPPKSSSSVEFQGQHFLRSCPVPVQQQQRRLRAWHKLTGSELSPSRFRPYVAQHIHVHCTAQPSVELDGNTSSPAFTVRYLRRQADLRKHAEKVVLRELKKRHRHAAAAAQRGCSSASEPHHSERRSSSSSVLCSDPGRRAEISKLSSEALAAKVKRLFESVIRQLVDDGVIEIAPERIVPMWPLNGRKHSRILHDRKQKRLQQSAAAAARGKNKDRRWGGDASEVFLSTKIPFLGSSETEEEEEEEDTRETPTRARTRRSRSRRAEGPGQEPKGGNEVPSSSGSCAVVDGQGRTVLGRGSTGANGYSLSSSSRLDLRKGVSAADAILVSSSPPPPPLRAREVIEICSSSSSNGDITSDTEESSSNCLSSSEDEDQQLGRGSPTPKAKRLRRTTMSATQQTAAVWKGGGVGKAEGRRKQEAYRLVTPGGAQ